MKQPIIAALSAFIEKRPGLSVLDWLGVAAFGIALGASVFFYL